MMREWRHELHLSWQEKGRIMEEEEIKAGSEEKRC